MKPLYTLLTAIIAFIACNKETATSETDVMNSMIANKNWYLDYSITANSTKSYVGQSTYFVTYLKDGTTRDSDGLNGTYKVEMNNHQSQIHVQVKTSNGNTMEVVYNIISVGYTKMVLSKQILTGTTAELYFTCK